MNAAARPALAPGLPSAAVGIGLRAPHVRELLQRERCADFLEVHSENYFADGGFDLHALLRLRERYPVSLHGVGLGLGSADDRFFETHLRALERLAGKVDPALVSEHLCWNAAQGRVYNELLPLPCDAAALDLVSRRIDRVQQVLRRPLLVENIAQYLRFDALNAGLPARADAHAAGMGEGAFLDRLAARTGCAILLDVNNLCVNEINLGDSATAQIDAIAPRHIAQIHVAGHRRDGALAIDDHGSTVPGRVWALYAHALRHAGPVPTLVEWDTDLPRLAVLLDEAQRAREVARQVADPGRRA